MPASWPRDAWPHSGFDPAARDSDGKLLPGDRLLRTWWCRPEVAPVEASCDAERALHAALIADPRRPVAAGEIPRCRTPMRARTTAWCWPCASAC
ncbi:DUF6352 family protein [Cupriavidus basilensis]